MLTVVVEHAGFGPNAVSTTVYEGESQQAADTAMRRARVASCGALAVIKAFDGDQIVAVESALTQEQLRDEALARWAQQQGCRRRVLAISHKPLNPCTGGNIFAVIDNVTGEQLARVQYPRRPHQQAITLCAGVAVTGINLDWIELQLDGLSTPQN